MSAGALAGLVGTPVKFEVAGQTHHLWVVKQGGQYKIMLASNPREIHPPNEKEIDKGAAEVVSDANAVEKKATVQGMTTLAEDSNQLTGELTRAKGFAKRDLTPKARYQSNCFVAGIPLQTPEGAKAIERFRPGDRLLARPESDPDAAAEAMLVEEVFVSVAVVFSVRISDHDIWTTPEHPFWVRGKGWVPATHLEAVNLLSSHDGRWVPVEAVNRADLQVTTVYNLRVAEHHTYFVGCDEWGFSVWAHNACIYHYGVPGKTVLPVGSWVTDKRQATWAEAISIGHLRDVRARGTRVSEYMFDDAGIAINWQSGLVNGGHQGRLAQEVTTFVETELTPPWATP